MPIQEDPAQLLFLSIFNPLVPLQNRDRISKHLMTLNYGLTFGNFELDFNDGEVRFRTTLNLMGMDLQSLSIHPLIKHLVYTNIATVDRHWHGLRQFTHRQSHPLST